MTTTMDIVVCLDCSSSITSDSNQIRSTVLSFLNQAVLCHGSDVWMALIEFRSHSDHWGRTRTHPFTSSINTFQEWIDNVQTDGGGLDGTKAIVDALSIALLLDWRPNNNVHHYHEKLVILITDGAPCGLLNGECSCNREDLWMLANKFKKKDIPLVVIGIEPSIVVCDDFYCALANKTGGEYLPLINASRVLSSVIQRAILEEDTLSQLFHHLNIANDIEYNAIYRYSYIQSRVRFMIECCRTMNDIRRWLFAVPRQPIENLFDGINSDVGSRINSVSDDDDDFKPHTPPSSSFRIDHFLSPYENILTSTPLTDDEGYRTRLPTTASADSSFTYICGSPVFSTHPFLHWHNGVDDDDDDDECF